MHEPSKHDQTPFPNPPVNSSGSGKGVVFGCLGCLGVMILVPLALVLVSYYVLFHTAIPLQMMVQEDFEMNGQQVEVQGLTGSISSGFEIEKVVIHDEPEDSSIEDIKFQYSGIWDAIQNQRIVIEEFSIGKSVFILDNDFLTSPDGSVNFGNPDFAGEDGFDDPDFDAPDFADSGGVQDGLFELRELKIANTTLKSRDGEVKIEIPLIRLAGLKVQGDHFELDELKVTSDFVDLELQDADLDSIGDGDYAFKKTIVGSVHPKVHPLIVNEIDFKYHLAASKGTIKGRVEAFGGKYTYAGLPDGSSLLELKDFTPADFFDCEGLVIPEKVSVKTLTSNETIDIEPGNFNLGKTKFEIEKQTIDESSLDRSVKAKANVGDVEISATIRENKGAFWPPVKVELESSKPMANEELLSLVYHHRSYQELNAEEKAQIDARAESLNAGAENEEPVQ